MPWITGGMPWWGLASTAGRKTRREKLERRWTLPRAPQKTTSWSWLSSTCTPNDLIEPYVEASRRREAVGEAAVIPINRDLRPERARIVDDDDPHKS